MKEYLVIASYDGECCPSAHILAARVQAESPQAAEERLAQYIQNVKENEPDEILALPAFEAIPTLEQIQAEFVGASG